MKRGKVFKVIHGERDYQDIQQEGGRFQKQIHTVGEELLLIKEYLDRAIAKYANSYGDAPALHGIRKVAALAVRCMENHGALPRESKNPDPIDRSIKDEKKITTKDEDAAIVTKAREIWFKELLERFLPEVFGKLLGEGDISIPPSCIEGEIREKEDEDEVPF